MKKYIFLVFFCLPILMQAQQTGFGNNTGQSGCCSGDEYTHEQTTFVSNDTTYFVDCHFKEGLVIQCDTTFDTGGGGDVVDYTVTETTPNSGNYDLNADGVNVSNFNEYTPYRIDNSNTKTNSTTNIISRDGGEKTYANGDLKRDINPDDANCTSGSHSFESELNVGNNIEGNSTSYLRVTTDNSCIGTDKISLIQSRSQGNDINTYHREHINSGNLVIEQLNDNGDTYQLGQAGYKNNDDFYSFGAGNITLGVERGFYEHSIAQIAINANSTNNVLDIELKSNITSVYVGGTIEAIWVGLGLANNITEAMNFTFSILKQPIGTTSMAVSDTYQDFTIQCYQTTTNTFVLRIVGTIANEALYRGFVNVNGMAGVRGTDVLSVEMSDGSTFIGGGTPTIITANNSSN